LDSNRVTLKHFEPERAYSRDVVSRRAASTLGVVRTRARRGAGKSTGSWPGAVGTVRLRVVTRANSHCRRPVSYLLRSCTWPSSAPHFVGLRAAAEAPPPAITGHFSGQSTHANRPHVSQIEQPAHLFASSGPTLPSASSPRRRGHGCEVDFHLGTRVQVLRAWL
jgi:hypothetical protein